MATLYEQLRTYPVVIAGPCVIESEALVLQVAEFLKDQQAKNPDWQIVFKASFDKANRTSLQSFRGPGLEEGLRILGRVRTETGLPVLTDIHEPHQAEAAGRVADILQIPAFLSRQTDLLVAAAQYGDVVNIKKAQFMAGADIQHSADKVAQSGNPNILLTERGTAFGYHNLVVDFRNLVDMQALGYPVVFDATHAVQQPGGAGGASGGQRQYIAPLARAASGMGVSHFFFEIHPEPDEGLSDAANMYSLTQFESLVAQLKDQVLH
jgi:2-dehydro-3-deoxyphosphooctonate aldolase (KDO 8-P synthase)